MSNNWLQAFQFSVHFINLLIRLLRYNRFIRIQKAVVNQMGSSRPPNSDQDLYYWCNLRFGKCFGPSSWSSDWAGHCQLYKTHFSSQVTIQLRNGMLLHRTRKDNNSKWQLFLLAVSSWDTHLSRFFTFPICFKCWTTIEWSTLSSLAASYVAVRGLALMFLSNGCHQLPMASYCTPHLQGSCLLCKISWPTTALFVH